MLLNVIVGWVLQKTKIDLFAKFGKVRIDVHHKKRCDQHKGDKRDHLDRYGSVSRVVKQLADAKTIGLWWVYHCRHCRLSPMSPFVTQNSTGLCPIVLVTLFLIFVDMKRARGEPRPSKC